MKQSSPFQQCKLTRQNSENAEKWMGRLRIVATGCSCPESDMQLEEQLIHGLVYY